MARLLNIIAQRVLLFPTLSNTLHELNILAEVTLPIDFIQTRVHLAVLSFKGVTGLASLIQLYSVKVTVSYWGI
jgi:hypothetical protein